MTIYCYIMGFEGVEKILKLLGHSLFHLHSTISVFRVVGLVHCHIEIVIRVALPATLICTRIVQPH